MARINGSYEKPFWIVQVIKSDEDDTEVVCGLSQGVMPSELPVQEADCRNSQHPFPSM